MKTILLEDGDIVIGGSSGRPEYIEGIRKLSQDVAHALLSQYVPEYQFGSEVQDIVSNNSRASFLHSINAAYIRNRIEEALQRLKSMQQTRPERLSPFETLDKVQDVRVYSINSTDYVFMVDVKPKAGPDRNPQTFSVRLGHQLP